MQIDTQADEPRAALNCSGLLRRGAADGTLFVPVSEAVVLELLKQDDPSSRLATAALIDELSQGVT